MGIYLLLEERVGPLTEKQTELLLAARDDSERLVGILEDLLDIHRIESGKSLNDLQPLPLIPLPAEEECCMNRRPEIKASLWKLRFLKVFPMSWLMQCG